MDTWPQVWSLDYKVNLPCFVNYNILSFFKFFMLTEIYCTTKICIILAIWKHQPNGIFFTHRAYYRFEHLEPIYRQKKINKNIFYDQSDSIQRKSNVSSDKQMSHQLANMCSRLKNEQEHTFTEHCSFQLRASEVLTSKF